MCGLRAVTSMSDSLRSLSILSLLATIPTAQFFVKERDASPEKRKERDEDEDRRKETRMKREIRKETSSLI